MQTEDVYEGISSPQCRCLTRHGLLKPQKFSDVSTITGSIEAVIFFNLDEGNRMVLLGAFQRICTVYLAFVFNFYVTDRSLQNVQGHRTAQGHRAGVDVDVTPPTGGPVGHPPIRRPCVTAVCREINRDT